MNTSHKPAEVPCAVPLEELLERIPADARYVYTEPDGLKATHFIPIGRYAHEAAATLRQHAELLERVKGLELALMHAQQFIDVPGYQNDEREKLLAFISAALKDHAHD